MNLSFQRLFFAIATVFAFFAMMILAKPILIPIGFALLISFILLPLAVRFELWGANRMLAAFLSIFTTILILGGGIFLFSTQIIEISKDLSDVKEKVLRILAELTLYINSNLNFVPDLEKGELLQEIKDWINKSAGSLVKQTFNSTATFITGLMFTVIFTFLILIYRKGMVNAFAHFYPDDKRQRAVTMFKSVQQVGKRYLVGMILIIIIVGVLNSLGLLIIGLDNPFLFGFMASIMAIVPYVGTTLGAAIPVVYSFMTYDSIWMPISVTILFWSVQVVESNYLTPRIVGGGLKVNALAAILSIIIGASVWGIAGMVLFLPFVAILKVISEEYVELKPIALMIGEQNQKKDDGSVSFGSRLWGKIKRGCLSFLSNLF
jgi:predicted PurR-regulated permease PerM